MQSVKPLIASIVRYSSFSSQITLPDKTLCSGSAGVFLLRSVSFTGRASRRKNV